MPKCSLAANVRYKFLNAKLFFIFISMTTSRADWDNDDDSPHPDGDILGCHHDSLHTLAGYLTGSPACPKDSHQFIPICCQLLMIYTVKTGGTTPTPHLSPLRHRENPTRYWIIEQYRVEKNESDGTNCLITGRYDISSWLHPELGRLNIAREEMGI